MNEIQLLKAQSAAERSRLAHVTRACAAGIRDARSESDRDALETFCRACAGYIVLVLARAIAQDRAHLAQLRTRLDATDREGHAALSGLEEALAARGAVLENLQGAIESRSAGSLDREGFIHACGLAVERLQGIPAAWESCVRQLVERHYGVPEWRRASQMDADSILRERSSFARVRETLPRGMALEAVS